MALLQIGEVFGYPVSADSQAAQRARERKWCPFQNAICTKQSKKDPLGICSLTDGRHLATLCPLRFSEHNAIVRDVGRIAFGRNVRVAGVREVHILRVPGPRGTEKRIGKIDYMIAKLEANDSPVEFAALEVQAVYFSGHSLRPAFKEFMARGEFPSGTARRPDWRSSAQKRLMPQLSLKLPVFRRWGTKVFVAVDSLFFAELPPMQSAKSLENSELTWLVYPFGRQGSGYTIGDPRVIHTTWDDVQTALREGNPPEKSEVLAEIKRKHRESATPILTT